MKLQVVGAGIALALVSVLAPVQASDQFPFDRELILNTKPMKPAKRKPMITVEASGNAVIDLWCKSVSGKVEVDADAIRITAEPLPPDLPSMMAPGQCAPDRLAADELVLSALEQVTAWRRRGGGVELIGPQKLVFLPGTN